MSRRSGGHRGLAQKFSPERGRRVPAAQRRGRVGLSTRLRNYFALHFHVLTGSLSQMGRSKGGNFMTSAVIGIALAMPAAMHVFLQKVQALGGAWEESNQISLFLQAGVKDEHARRLAGQIQGWTEVSRVDYISPQQALEDFKTHSGMGDLLTMLDENPLPAVLVVTPAGRVSPSSLEALVERLQGQPAVDLVQLDMEWVQRLNALLALAERGVLVLGGLLGIAVLFVIGNTIRLAIQNRQDEIVVVKMIGGSDAFVRRPFLYFGMWFGLFGGLLAWGLVNLLLLLLDGPVQRLVSLYGSDFDLGAVELETTLLLLSIGPLLGLMGAWLVAGRRLRAIEPV